MDGEKAINELSTELMSDNFGWDADEAASAAEFAHNLPKFPTYNFYYLAAALELRKRLNNLKLEEQKKSKKTTKKVEDYDSADYLALINKILKKTKRPKSLSKATAAAEPSTIISYYLALQEISEKAPVNEEEEEEFYPTSGEEEQEETEPGTENTEQSEED